MKKGVALIWAVVLCTVLMLIATIITTSVIKETQFSVRIDNSVRAYSAASSGIEWGKYCLQSQLEKNAGTTTPDPASLCMSANPTFTIKSPSDAKYTVNISKVGLNYVIKSTGQAGTDVKRVLEYVYQKADLTPISNGDLNLTVLNSPNGYDKGFSLTYDFWVIGNYPIEFGVRDASNSQKITVLFNNTAQTMSLSAKNNTVTSNPSTISLGDNALSTTDTYGIGVPYQLQVQIKYLHNNSATLTLKRRFHNPSNPALDFKVENCSARTSIDLSTPEYQFVNPFKYFYLDSGNAGIVAAVDTIGDGSVTKLSKTLPVVTIGYIDSIIMTSADYR
ncbi:MAG: hypothetical protein WCI63_03475 [bacterium]